MKGSFRLKSSIFCNLNSYYILIQWCCLTLVCIFPYYWTCRQCSISQPELYSQEEFRAGIAWSIAGKAFIEREMKQKQLHCLNKLIDFKTWEGRRGPGVGVGPGVGRGVLFTTHYLILSWRVGVEVARSKCLSIFITFCSYLYPDGLVWTALRYTAGFSLLKQSHMLQHLLLKLQTLFP